MIHLAIAERAAAAGWFEFNPGEITSATTSPAWTALTAALLSLGGFPLALPVLALVPVAALAGTAALISRAARRLGASASTALLGGLLFASLPGVAFNAPLGMENVVFAGAALAFLLAITIPDKIRSSGVAAALGALLGLCVLLRPEGVVLAVAVAVVARDAAGEGARLGPSVLALTAVAVVGPVAYAHWRITGCWLPGSGLSRLMAARRDVASFHVGGPVWLYLATPARLLVQLPMAWLAFEGARPPRPAPTTRRALLGTLAAGGALYTLVTGAAHVARVTGWLWALLAVFAAVGISRQLALAAAGARGRSRGLAIACVAHVAIACAETVIRARTAAQFGGGMSRVALQRAIDRRRVGTDRMLRGLCEGGCCRDGAVPFVAMVEVQRRLSLDERVSVASLDGVTSPTRGRAPAVSFDAATGCPRMDGLLADQRVLGVLENPASQLARCATSPLARALSEAWDNPSVPSPSGWRWSVALHGWMRRCDPIDQPASSTASSISSASRTVARRTAASLTAPSASSNERDTPSSATFAFHE